MIKIKRTQKPQVLVQNEQRWADAILAATTREEKERAVSKYQHEDIKNALIDMCHSKCVYCESKLTHITYGDIEHFKPKSKYPEKSVEWRNLLLSCEVCNRTFKRDIDNEQLINPSDDEPNDHFHFDFDTSTKLANVLGITDSGLFTEKSLALNRYGLIKQRSSLVYKLWLLSNYYYTNPEVKEILDEAAQDSSEYSAFAKTIILKIQK